MPINYEKYLMVPVVIQDYVEAMMKENNYEKRDHYRLRIQSIIEFCNLALENEVQDRVRRSNIAKAKREKEKRELIEDIARGKASQNG